MKPHQYWICHKRRTKEFSPKNLICSYYSWECQLCFKRFPIEKLIIHHIVPLFLGGKNHWANTTLLCGECHKITHKQWDFLRKDYVNTQWRLWREEKLREKWDGKEKKKR